MAGVGCLLVAAIALYFQFKINNKQPQISQQQINDNSNYNFNNF